MNGRYRNSFLYNFILVLLLCTAFYFLFFSTLGVITRHGSETVVPKVAGKNMSAALKELEAMEYEVDIDSSYDPAKKPYIVLQQIPDSGSTVKRGRTVFLTVNKSMPPMTPMPKLQDLSYRSAIMIIGSSRLVLGDTIHRPDYAKGAVLDQLYNGKHINAGDMLPQGSKIDIVIGDGFGNVEMNVPDVIGMTAAEGIAILSGNGLTVTDIWDAPITDSATAVIYMQSPAPYNELNAPNRILEGDVINILIKQEPAEGELEHNRRPAPGVNDETIE